MSGTPVPGAVPLQTVLIVSEELETENELSLPQLLNEVGGERIRWVCWTVMDAFMKPFPGGLAAVVMDVGMLSPLHRELLEKIAGEAGLPVLVHLTDNRLETIRWLGGVPGVRHLRKPASLHEVMATVAEMVQAGK